MPDRDQAVPAARTRGTSTTGPAAPARAPATASPPGCSGRHRHRHRRQHPDPGRLLRHLRADADVRPRAERGLRAARLLARPHRAAGPLGRDCGAMLRRHRRLRPARPVRASTGRSTTTSPGSTASWPACGSASSASTTSPTQADPAAGRRSRRRSRRSTRWAPRSSRSCCRTTPRRSRRRWSRWRARRWPTTATTCSARWDGLLRRRRARWSASARCSRAPTTSRPSGSGASRSEGLAAVFAERRRDRRARPPPSAPRRYAAMETGEILARDVMRHDAHRRTGTRSATRRSSCRWASPPTGCRCRCRSPAGRSRRPAPQDRRRLPAAHRLAPRRPADRRRDPRPARRREGTGRCSACSLPRAPDVAPARPSDRQAATVARRPEVQVGDALVGVGDRSTVASANGLPMICIDSGRPCAPKPTGSGQRRQPAEVPVRREHRRDDEHLERHSSARWCLAEADGVISTSTSRKMAAMLRRNT